MASEIDKFAAKAYEAIYGYKPKGDITKIDAKEVPDHDILTAGFPCQAFSIAGKRLGFEDTRGTLFFEVARIAKEKKPKVVLLENVKGLVSHDKGRTLKVILNTMEELGYTVWHKVLNSKYFGVPQNRERIFIVCIREPKREFKFPNNNEVTTRLRDILEDDVDKKYYLSEEKTKRLLATLKENWDPKKETDKPQALSEGEGVSLCLDANYHKGVYSFKQSIRTHIGVKYEVRPVITPDRLNKKQNGRRFKGDGEPSFTVTATDRHGIALGYYPNYKIRRLTPLECMRLQGFPDEYYHTMKKIGISDTQIYKMAGNAVTVNVVEEICKNILEVI